MRLAFITVALWALMLTTASADVLPSDDLPFPRYPAGPPVRRPIVPRPAPVEDEEWHPNIEIDPNEPATPEEVGFVAALVAAAVLLVSVRESQRSERRPA